MGELLAEYAELDFEAEQGLQDAVVQIAGNAAALGFDGPVAQMAQQEEVFQRRPDVADDLFEPTQVGGQEAAVGRVGCRAPAGPGGQGIDQEDAPGRAVVKFEGGGEQRSRGKLVSRGLRGRREGSEAASGAAVPAESVTVPVGEIPADRGFHGVEQEGVGAAERKGFWHRGLGLIGTYAPDEDAVEILIPGGQTGLLAIERQGQFSQHLADRLVEAAFEAEQAGDGIEKLLAGQMLAFAGAEESDAQAGDEHSQSDGGPARGALPLEWLGQSEADDDAGNGQGDHRAQRAPMAACRQGEDDEQQEQPKSEYGMRETQKQGEHGEVGSDRNLQLPGVGKASGERGSQSNGQIERKKRDGKERDRCGRGFQQSDQRESRQDGPRQRDLPLQVHSFYVFQGHGGGQQPIQV